MQENKSNELFISAAIVHLEGNSFKQTFTCETINYLTNAVAIVYVNVTSVPNCMTCQLILSSILYCY